jgi:alpha-L-rhamnosidase
VVVLFGLVLAVGQVGGGPTAGGLRCEYLVDPINVEVGKPRLGWVDAAPGRGWGQEGYQILAASSKSLLTPGKADLWDSGHVVSKETTQIEYAGKELSSRAAAYWKVRVWGKDGSVSAWSSVGRWEMGVLGAADWKGAEWIGLNGPAAANPAPYLRKDFALSGKVARARVYVSGLGYAQLSLNGKQVAPTVERDPGYTNFDKRVLYVAYDVTNLLRPAHNALGAILGSGWYDVHDKATWNFDRAAWRGRPRMKLLLAVDYVNGKTEFIPSDSSWKATTGPILTDGIYTGETYDARKEIVGWDLPKTDVSSWPVVDVLPAPKGKLAARVCAPVVLGESIAAKSIKEPKPGVYIVDFGQNFAGHAELKLREPAGTQVRMRYSEKLDKDGMIERSQIEQFMAKATPPQPFQTDTYICRGGGTETWEQRFSYSGFRWMEVTGLMHKPSLGDFVGRFEHTDFASAGEFSCSNELLNKIQRATRYSYLSNAQSIPTDCPQREKNGWTGDAQLAAEAGLMNFHSASFYTKWLDDLADTENKEGMMSLIVPSAGWGRGARHPAWDSAYPIVAYDLYLYRNDKRILAKHYENLKRYVDSLSTELKDGVLTFDSLGDWLPWSTETPSQFTSTLFLFVDAQIMENSAKLLGHPKDAAKYAELAETVKTGVDKHFFDAAKGVYANGSQTANSMALYVGIVPTEKRDVVLKHLVEETTAAGHIDTGIIGAKTLIRELSEAGQSELAYKIVSRKEQPGWGWWIEQGATTLWEDWKGESSLNHIMFGDVSNWFFQWIAGIRLDKNAPGFSHVVIGPEPVGDLTWAKALYDSPHGRIVSSWRKAPDGFHLDVTIPANVTATLILPGSGIVREGGVLLADTDGVSRVRKEGGRTVAELGSGSYSFVSASR